MGAGSRTHVSGIKSIAGTEKILVPQKLIHNVKQRGKRKEGGQKRLCKEQTKGRSEFHCLWRRAGPPPYLPPFPSPSLLQAASPWEAPNLPCCTKAPVCWLSFSFCLFRVEVGISFQARRRGGGRSSVQRVSLQKRSCGGQELRWFQVGRTHRDMGCLGLSGSLLSNC